MFVQRYFRSFCQTHLAPIRNTRPTSENNAEQTAGTELTAEATHTCTVAQQYPSPDLKAAEVIALQLFLAAQIMQPEFRVPAKQIALPISRLAQLPARIHVGPTDDEICDAVVSITIIKQPQFDQQYIPLDHTTHESS